MLDGDGQMSVDAGSLLYRFLILQSDHKANASLVFQVFSSFFKFFQVFSSFFKFFQVFSSFFKFFQVFSSFLFDILPFRNYITKHDPADASTVGPTPRKGRFFFGLDQSLGARQLLREDTDHRNFARCCGYRSVSIYSI